MTSTFAQGDDFPAPATTSEESQAALARFSRATRNAPLPAANDVAGWKKVQTEVEEKRAAASAAVVKEYQPDIAERKLAGVPVLEIRPKGWNESGKVLVCTGSFFIKSTPRLGRPRFRPPR